MDGRIAATLERLEERIESIKWMLITTFSTKRTGGVSTTISAIRRSAGILGKNAIKGTAFENGIRRKWRSGFAKRAA